MIKPKLKRPSLGTVLGFTALVIAIGGTAHAATSHPSTKTIIVRKGEIAKGAVTAKALAPGAVHAIAIANGAVTKGKLAKEAVSTTAFAPGSVSAAALAPDAVTAGAIAPGSVYGGALGQVTIHAAPIADIDEVAHNGEWTASDSVTASCGSGEHLLTGGVAFANPGDRQVAIIESLPFVNSTSNGVVGRITSDSGGTAAAEVQTICLK
jgi:hypothetical protein